MAGQVIQGDEEEALSDINVVPLTDVMLVLLIVFLITTQVIKQAVPITLPNVRYEPTTTAGRGAAPARTAAPSEPVRTPTTAK